MVINVLTTSYWMDEALIDLCWSDDSIISNRKEVYSAEDDKVYVSYRGLPDDKLSEVIRLSREMKDNFLCEIRNSNTGRLIYRMEKNI